MTFCKFYTWKTHNISYIVSIHIKMFDFYKFTHKAMMKKNLFLLFSSYFLVLQPVFIALLRWETNFFRLAVINFVFIILVVLLSKNQKWDNKNTEQTENTEKIHKIQKKKIYKPIPHIWLFIISILFGFFVWFWLGDIVLHLQLLISVAGSFILFIILGLLFKFKIFRVRESKVYMISLILLLIWSAIGLFNINFLNIQNNIDADVSTWSEIDLVDFVSVDEIEEDMEDIEDSVVVSVDEDLDRNANFEDVIKYLIGANEITLNASKNIKFTYIPYSSVDYPYYRTAYAKKMIGKNVNPEKTLLCETYIVMKWLSEWRSVWSYSDIKKAYWNYAKANDELPNCEYWDYTKVWDLK